MKKKDLSPSGVAAPFGKYSHGILVPQAGLVATSGQLGNRPDGSVPQGVRDQAKACLENIRLILADGGLELDDVLRLNAYVTDREHMSGYMQVRDEFFSAIEPKPASTLMVVSGFTREEFLVEVEALAFRADSKTQ